MANADSTLSKKSDLDVVDVLDNLSHDTHKLVFLQDVLTLQANGKLTEGLETAGLYFIMQEIIVSLKGTYEFLDMSRASASNPLSQTKENDFRKQVAQEALADVIKSEFESLYLSLEGLRAVSDHSQIGATEVDAVMNVMNNAKDSIQGLLQEVFV